MIDPDDFLRLAKMLAAESFAKNEAALRTAISRAYYSSFLKCKMFAVENGQIQLREYDRPEHPRPGEIHRAVRDALFEIDYGRIAAKLKGLFDMRVTADYRHQDTVDNRAAGEAINLSEDIKRLVDEVRA